MMNGGLYSMEVVDLVKGGRVRGSKGSNYSLYLRILSASAWWQRQEPFFWGRGGKGYRADGPIDRSIHFSIRCPYMYNAPTGNVHEVRSRKGEK